MDSLEAIVRRYVSLPNTPSTKGWYSVRCLVCNDHTRKGLRGGFLFDRGTVSYHCFNCNHKATYSPEYNTRLPNDMLIVMNAFGIPEEEWQTIVFQALANEQTSKPKRTEITRSLVTKEIELPSHLYRISTHSNDKWSIVASEYLKELRGVDPTGYSFYLSNDKDWKARVIIPIYRNGKLIFYQGRDLTDKKINKYKSSSSSTNILYGFDELYKNTDLPLHVVEGFFDAYVINGVATLGNEFSTEQLQYLHGSKRPKVVIPDRKGDGYILAEQALKEGWSISFPDIGDCKDINDAVMRYGKLYVMTSIVNKTMSGIMAETALGVYCENKHTGKKKNQKAPRKIQ